MKSFFLIAFLLSYSFLSEAKNPEEKRSSCITLLKLASEKKQNGW